MNNVYFSNEGMTSTTANYYANIAKEFQNAATERLNSVKFFKTSVAVIGSDDKQLMSEGTSDLGFISKDLEILSSMNAFCAWVREAIKEKENQIDAVNRMNIEDWAKQCNITLPVAPVAPKDPGVISELDVMNSWDINKRNKFLKLEAYAATLGKYIHPDGAYSKARKKAHTALNNPITTNGTGRDMILYYTEPSVSIHAVDDVFMALQDQYRSYEKELNQMKAELKETSNTLTTEAYNKFQADYDLYREQSREFAAAWAEVRAQFTNWRTSELERLAKLKITIPKALKPVFDELKAVGDTSK